MSSLQINQIPVASTAMRIRCPVEDIFEAIVNPEITTKFWFTKSSGRLEAGKTVRWDWEMYGVGTDVFVKSIEPNQRIVMEWDGDGSRTQVEWTFQSLPDRTTFISVTNSSFMGDGDSQVNQAIDSVQGFALVLAGLKALLEFNIELNLVRDRFPQEVSSLPRNE